MVRSNDHSPEGVVGKILEDIRELQRRIGRSSGGGGGGAVTPLPAPVRVFVDGLRTISATAWADVPDAAVSLYTASAVRVLVTAGAWMTATGGETRAAIAADGANTITPPAPGWGQTMYASASDGSGTVQRSIQQVVDLQPGVTTFKIQAYRGGAAGTNQVNYATLEVTPLTWIGAGPEGLAPTRGDAALRDATYPPPANETERQALYGTKWWRTDGGYEETFYPTHTALGASTPAGWHRTNWWKYYSWKPPLINSTAERNGVGVVVHQDGAVVTLNVGIILPTATSGDSTVLNNVLPRPMITNQFLSRDGVGSDQNMWVTVDGGLVIRRNSSTGPDTPFAATGTYITQDPILL